MSLYEKSAVDDCGIEGDRNAGLELRLRGCHYRRCQHEGISQYQAKQATGGGTAYADASVIVYCPAGRTGRGQEITIFNFRNDMSQAWHGTVT